MSIIQKPSPNFDEREGHDIDMLVLHYTGMKTGEEALARLCDPAAKVSAHYVVEEDGRIFQLVEESMRAWHAGVSFWRGATNINQRSIGIEIVNPGHEFGYRPFPRVQTEAVLALCQGILARHAIGARNVVGHSDVAPTRKEDPGEYFDWQLLAAGEVGLWPSAQENLPLADKRGLPARLSAYGYDAADLPRAITAFQRHFRPKTVSGEWDTECAALLASLLQLAGVREID